ncbi:MAG: putative toxin-antitoxin system toxin component, PIN family [Betaproteobacteria bacterium]|nr:MAG: putative toxin-antitoxin system toxin component, PIN family [Betaproteobacteria bacterium]
MRLVLDTNVVASGLLWDSGPPARLLDAAGTRRVELFTSVALLSELARILAREKFARHVESSALSIDDLVLGYAALSTVIAAASISPTVVQDPDDDVVLACALAAQADAIVSGDHRLLNLKTYHGIDIVSPTEALRRAASS